VGCVFLKFARLLERLLSEEPVVMIGKSAGRKEGRSSVFFLITGELGRRRTPGLSSAEGVDGFRSSCRVLWCSTVDITDTVNTAQTGQVIDNQSTSTYAA
jgi:hypothetical protein